MLLVLHGEQSCWNSCYLHVFFLPNSDWRRKIFLLCGILFHFGIGIIHGLVSFYCTMLVALILYLSNYYRPYVRAARALGVSNSRIILRHVLPNALVATITFMPFTLAGSVTILTSLDFLGFGLPPGSPSLGELLAQGKANLQAPWLGVSGFVVIGLMLSLLIFIGEGVRDAFDPKKLFR